MTNSKLAYDIKTNTMMQTLPLPVELVFGMATLAEIYTDHSSLTNHNEQTKSYHSSSVI